MAGDAAPAAGRRISGRRDGGLEKSRGRQKALLAVWRSDQLQAGGQRAARGHRERESRHPRQIHRKGAARDEEIVTVVEVRREDAQRRGHQKVDLGEDALERLLPPTLDTPGRRDGVLVEGAAELQSATHAVADPPGILRHQHGIGMPGLDHQQEAGLEGGVIVDKVRHLKGAHGLNAATGEYGDLFKDGVIDAAKVTRSALQNAASIAALFLTTEAVIVDKPEENAGGGMPGGMDDY